ncbi:tetratricopeptide repeat protein [Acinetobacter pittii]|uniref:tetratricopeptide repeat protein n=1 Tax=Acinetobacter pittii TaxID=48296 RepID=UPI0025B15DC8|nr:hypothetical protein [Acinetobacter pittii]
MSLPQKDTHDLEALFALNGLKNLDNFKIKATLSRAKRTAEALLQTEPAEGYHHLALIHAFSNNYDVSIDNFKKALRLQSNDAGLWANYSITLIDAGHILDSLNAHLKALELNPFNAKLFTRLNHFSNWYLYLDYQEKSFEAYKGKIDEKIDQPISLQTSQYFLDFLDKKNIKVETFRKQLVLANHVCNQFYQTNRLHLLAEANPEDGYLSRVLYLKDSSPQEVVRLNSLYEEEILKWLEQQEDGGFSLANELDDLILYFSVA